MVVYFQKAIFKEIKLISTYLIIINGTVLSFTTRWQHTKTEKKTKEHIETKQEQALI